MDSNRKPNKEIKSAIQSKGEIIPPEDYSFLELATITDIVHYEPRASLKDAAKKSKSGKSRSHGLKLNNNSISHLEELPVVILERFDKIEQLTWLDLSFNELNKIDEVLLKLTCLQSLLLHGNLITSLNEVDKLGGLRLKKLTLHGNALDKEKGYRQYVLSILPTLISLDFSGVTNQDRKTAEVWKKMFFEQKKNKKSFDDEN